VPEACRAMIREVSSDLPRPAEAQDYHKRHRVYQAIYPALKSIYGMIE